ncbi:helix-turn-helix domain-containing protein [Anaerotruncus massiliensis (ex Togo et al. 2019)]|jgi:predicted transcriptional regulator, xre family|uniref:helix-turn-helix domain-containing protein n=1 Tax=Anaerotruncus massiliensis (ex Togo et al. 2019) TaxID=1673720 RepID=UPI00208D100B|nr:helix-turn-helix transcriptional regulator [Anaerotruncus massiliensis (ex Togo et al. 2019)]GKH47109.1 hypothetical protein CE91St45_16710 [Oscillospiraceae bacterium]
MLRIRELRISADIMQKDLAKELGIPANTFNQYETGKREPDFETLKRIANHFHVSVDYLIGNDDKKNKPSIHKDEGLSEDALRVAEKFSRLTPEDQSKVEEYVALLASKDRQ